MYALQPQDFLQFEIGDANMAWAREYLREALRYHRSNGTSMRPEAYDAMIHQLREEAEAKGISFEHVANWLSQKLREQPPPEPWRPPGQEDEQDMEQFADVPESLGQLNQRRPPRQRPQPSQGDAGWRYRSGQAPSGQIGDLSRATDALLRQLGTAPASPPDAHDVQRITVPGRIAPGNEPDIPPTKINVHHVLGIGESPGYELGQITGDPQEGIEVDVHMHPSGHVPSVVQQVLRQIHGEIAHELVHYGQPDSRAQHQQYRATNPDYDAFFAGNRTPKGFAAYATRPDEVEAHVGQLAYLASRKGQHPEQAIDDYLGEWEQALVDDGHDRREVSQWIRHVRDVWLAHWRRGQFSDNPVPPIQFDRLASRKKESYTRVAVSQHRPHTEDEKSKAKGEHMLPKKGGQPKQGKKQGKQQGTPRQDKTSAQINPQTRQVEDWKPPSRHTFPPTGKKKAQMSEQFSADAYLAHLIHEHPREFAPIQFGEQPPCIRKADRIGSSCASCKHFADKDSDGEGRCKLYDYIVKHNLTCDAWTATKEEADMRGPVSETIENQMDLESDEQWNPRTSPPRRGEMVWPDPSEHDFRNDVGAGVPQSRSPVYEGIGPTEMLTALAERLEAGEDVDQEEIDEAVAMARQHAGGLDDPEVAGGRNAVQDQINAAMQRLGEAYQSRRSDQMSEPTQFDWKTEDYWKLRAAPGRAVRTSEFGRPFQQQTMADLARGGRGTPYAFPHDPIRAGMLPGDPVDHGRALKALYAGGVENEEEDDGRREAPPWLHKLLQPLLAWMQGEAEDERRMKGDQYSELDEQALAEAGWLWLKHFHGGGLNKREAQQFSDILESYAPTQFAFRPIEGTLDFIGNHLSPAKLIGRTAMRVLGGPGGGEMYDHSVIGPMLDKLWKAGFWTTKQGYRLLKGLGKFGLDMLTGRTEFDQDKHINYDASYGYDSPRYDKLDRGPGGGHTGGGQFSDDYAEYLSQEFPDLYEEVRA